MVTVLDYAESCNDYNSLKEVLDVAESNCANIYQALNAPILIPDSKNNDIDGSSKHPYKVYFTYREATMEDISSASSIAYYEYFKHLDGDSYTGNQYEGSGSFIEAFVVDPPSYVKTSYL